MRPKDATHETNTEVHTDVNVQDTNVTNSQDDSPDTQEVNETPDYSSLDELLGGQPDEYHKGMKPLHEWIKVLPPDAQKHIVNMRKAMAQSQQEAAKERKLREALEAKALKEKAELFGHIDKLEIPDAPADLWSEDGLNAAMKAKGLEAIKDAFKPLYEEARLEQAKLKVKTFIENNKADLGRPEFEASVRDIMLKNQTMSLEDAFWIAKGKESEQLRNTLEIEKQKLQQHKVNTLQKLRNGKAGNLDNEDLRGLPATEVYRRLKARTSKQYGCLVSRWRQDLSIKEVLRPSGFGKPQVFLLRKPSSYQIR